MERFEQTGVYRRRDGLAKERGMKNHCKKKVCFVSADQSLLEDILFELSKANDCYDVKYSTVAREGAFSGLCHLTNESAVGDVWARYEAHPKVWATVQDDEFCAAYRSQVRTY